MSLQIFLSFQRGKLIDGLTSSLMIDGSILNKIMHVPTCDKFRNEFLALYHKDFESTGGGLMETF
jgi:hypothetical protein